MRFKPKKAAEQEVQIKVEPIEQVEEVVEEVEEASEEPMVAMEVDPVERAPLADRILQTQGLPFLIQLPPFLPVAKGPTSQIPGEEAETAAAFFAQVVDSRRFKDGDDLATLPSGRMGKLRVYRDGSVRVQIGDVTYTLKDGVHSRIHQEFVAINPIEGQMRFLPDFQDKLVLSL